MSDPPNYDDFMYLRSVDKGHFSSPWLRTKLLFSRISEHEPEDSDYIKLIDRNGYKTHPLPSYYEVMRK